MRDIRRAIEEYNRRFIKGGDGRTGEFYANDFLQLADISGGVMTETTYNAIYNSLAAGFMIGYRCAQRQARKNKAPANSAK